MKQPQIVKHLQKSEWFIGFINTTSKDGLKNYIQSRGVPLPTILMFHGEDEEKVFTSFESDLNEIKELKDEISEKLFAYADGFNSEVEDFIAERLHDDFEDVEVHFKEKMVFCRGHFNLCKLIFSRFVDFYYFHEGIDCRLKLCPVCNRLFIHGLAVKPKRFCSTECSKIFHAASPEKVTEYKRMEREHKRKQKSRRDYEAIVKILMKDHRPDHKLTIDEAKKEAHNWIYEKKKSLSTYRKFYGL